MAGGRRRPRLRFGAAVIVAFVTLKAAGKQRENDTTLAQEQRDADRTLAQQQRDADADRTAKQLAHDRDMRNLQYLRETLTPIAEHAIGWDAFTSLHFELTQAEGREFEEWREAIGRPVNQVSDTAEKLRLDRRVLVILLGPDAEVAEWLGELASDGDALIRITRERVEAKRTTTEISAALDGLWMKFGFDQARFIEQANKVVRVSEAEPAKS
jgi:hypothetical protein